LLSPECPYDVSFWNLISPKNLFFWTFWQGRCYCFVLFPIAFPPNSSPRSLLVKFNFCHIGCASRSWPPIAFHLIGHQFFLPVPHVLRYVYSPLAHTFFSLPPYFESCSGYLSLSDFIRLFFSILATDIAILFFLSSFEVLPTFIADDKCFVPEPPFSQKFSCVSFLLPVFQFATNWILATARPFPSALW